jgi:hypothetical protein
VAKVVAHRFYSSSKEFKELNGFDEEDLRSVLYEKVIFSNYIPVRDGAYSSEEAFRNACWTSCLNACRNHFKMLFMTKKRFHIEAPTNASVAVEDRKQLQELVRDCCNECECPIGQRIILLLGYGRYTTKSSLRKALPVPRGQFERAWAEAKRIFSENIEPHVLPTLVFCDE